MKHTRRTGAALTELEHPNFTRRKLTPEQLKRGDLSGLVPVQIDSRTTIYCQPGTEQGAVERYNEIYKKSVI